MTYSEKLRDPRWQKRRLEILERDKFSCCCCGDKSNPLNVHHRFYSKDREPWEYPGICLITLCDECHEKWHKDGPFDIVEPAASALYFYLESFKIPEYQVDYLAETFREVGALQMDRRKIIGEITRLVARSIAAHIQEINPSGFKSDPNYLYHDAIASGSGEIAVREWDSHANFQ